MWRSGEACHFVIATFMTLKSIFRLAGRQTQGFLESLFALMKIEKPVPDHSTVSRRLQDLEIALPVKPSSHPRHVVVDSTGVKVYGEGEWKTRQHGVSKRRTWRKLHLGVDEKTGEILVAEVTTNDFGDNEILESLLEGIDSEIEQVSGDGAYDTFECHDTLHEQGIKGVIPPKHNACISRSRPNTYPRNEIIARIEEIGRTEWKIESDYHRRSIAENTIFRLKSILGGELSSRTFENQSVELFIKCAALNRMIQIAKPQSHLVTI
jgi:IS5 family transposase